MAPTPEGEVDRGLVVQDDQAVLPADDGMVDVVLDAVLAWDQDVGTRRSGRTASRMRASDVIFEPMREDQEAVGRRATQRRPEAVVLLVMDEYVVRSVGAERVPPDLVRPPGIVDRRVEEVVARRGTR